MTDIEKIMGTEGSAMIDHILDAAEYRFSLSLTVNVFEKDVENNCPINATVTAFVKCNGFSATADMDVGVEDLARFAKDLLVIYGTLNGEATLKDFFGPERFITFKGEGNGFINVNGYLCDDMKTGELYFQNRFDQTYLKDFANGFADTYLKYKKE